MTSTIIWTAAFDQDAYLVGVFTPRLVIVRTFLATNPRYARLISLASPGHGGSASGGTDLLHQAGVVNTTLKVRAIRINFTGTPLLRIHLIVAITAPILAYACLRINTRGDNAVATIYPVTVGCLDRPVVTT
jgi:hypothetical protein